MGEVLTLPVSADTCTVLGSRYRADEPAWTGLALDKAQLRTQSVAMLLVAGLDAPLDLHLAVPWNHPDDTAAGLDAECMYRVRPMMEAGRRWRGRLVRSVVIERDESRQPPWVLRVEFAGTAKAQKARPP